MKISTDLNISINVALSYAAELDHEFVTLEHLLYALCLDDDTRDVLGHCGANPDEIKADCAVYLRDEIEAVKGGLDKRPEVTRAFQYVLSRAWAHCEGSGRDEVKGPNVLVALFAETDSFAVYILEKHGVTRLDVISFLSHGISKIDPSHGSDMVPAGIDQDDEEGGIPKGKDALAEYTTNLNELAAKGGIDPLIGRAKEVQRLFHILQRRRKNNPVLVGESGVGKTAIVEGLAWRISRGEVPDQLKDAVVYTLDMGALLAGTRFRGDFEQRLKGVVKRLTEIPKSILFIDEIHTVVGAGSTSGSTMDASNILKPPLSNGQIRCIGATTFSEFRRFFERDRALSRRFQKVDVQEPSIDETVKILKGLQSRYEEHHGVKYSRKAIESAAHLSARYLKDRQLPDKAIDLLDESGAASALAGRTTVREADIESTLATMAQIPPKRVQGDDKERLRNLPTLLKSMVFGQDKAIDELASAVKVARAGLRTPDKPIGCYLFTGPTGVGKTEVAKRLAEILDVNFLRYDMSEYMERHTVSRLVGAPPGYVGHDQGGLLTEDVSKNPHAVLLLDEIEKAHPDVFNILLQIMDHGTLTDTHGKKADFRHVILIMTSNLGARALSTAPMGFGERSSAGADDKAFTRAFNPEFRNRLDARIGFTPLSPDVMGRIVDKFMAEFEAQLAERKVAISMTDNGRRLLAEKGFDTTYGARPLARVIDELVKRPMTDEILFGRLEHGGTLSVDAEDGKIVLRYPESNTGSGSEGAKNGSRQQEDLDELEGDDGELAH